MKIIKWIISLFKSKKKSDSKYKRMNLNDGIGSRPNDRVGKG